MEQEGSGWLICQSATRSIARNMRKGTVNIALSLICCSHVRKEVPRMPVRRGSTTSTKVATRIFKSILARYYWKNRLRHWFLAPFGRLRKPLPLLWDKY